MFSFDCMQLASPEMEIGDVQRTAESKTASAVPQADRHCLLHVRSRIEPAGVAAAAGSLMREGRLFCGLGTSMMIAIPSGTLYWTLFDVLRQTALSDNQRAAVASLMTTCATYPLTSILSAQQSSKTSLSLIEAVGVVTAGPRGVLELYRGLGYKLPLGMLKSSLSNEIGKRVGMIYDKIANKYKRNLQKRNSSDFVVFGSGEN